MPKRCEQRIPEYTSVAPSNNHPQITLVSRPEVDEPADHARITHWLELADRVLAAEESRKKA